MNKRWQYHKQKDAYIVDWFTPGGRHLCAYVGPRAEMYTLSEIEERVFSIQKVIDESML